MSEWPRPVVIFQILAKDKAKQEDFYRQMFDWEITVNEAFPIVSQIAPGKGPPEEGIGGTIVQNDNPALTIYVQVADLDASLKQAVELGGKVALPRLDVPAGPTIAQIEDPEGNLVGLVQM